MLPVTSVLARAGMFALAIASTAAALPTSALALPTGTATLAQAQDLVVPVEDDAWIRRRPWNNSGDFNNTDPGRPPEDWRRRNGHRWDNDGWRRGHWDDDYYPRYRRRPTVYFDLDLTPQRYIQPRYYEQRRVYRGLPRAHVAWCFDRYRSYRASDNSFQPNYGPRRQCRSPYY